MPCAGNSREICGGGWANTVYAIGGHVRPTAGRPTESRAEKARACALALLSKQPTANDLLAEYRRRAANANEVPVALTEGAVEAWLRDACFMRCWREVGGAR